MGGSNHKNNLVLLTAREHLLIHQLLIEMNPESDKLKYAFWRMATSKSAIQLNLVNSRIYELARVGMANATSNRLKGKVSQKNGKKFGPNKSNGKPRPPRPAITKKKISNSLMGHIVTQETREKLKYERSEELRFRISETLKTRNSTADYKNPFKGKTHSPQTLARMSKTLQELPTLQCCFCDMKSKSRSNMKRYHFDNCKYRI
jgi:hypothetical protein